MEDKIIRKHDLLKIIGVSHPTIWRWEKRGNFPKRIPLGKNSTGWLASEIKAWMKKKAEAR